jgi:hypothetical protein
MKLQASFFPLTPQLSQLNLFPASTQAHNPDKPDWTSYLTGGGWRLQNS